AVTVGGAGGSTATIQTNSGGSFTTGTAGMTINASGLVDVAGGTFTLNGNATINGTLQRAVGATFTCAASKTMTVQNGGDFLITGSYSLPTSASVTVTGTGSSLAQNTSGNLTISGATALTISPDATVNAPAGHISHGGSAAVK